MKALQQLFKTKKIGFTFLTYHDNIAVKVSIIIQILRTKKS